MNKKVIEKKIPSVRDRKYRNKGMLETKGNDYDKIFIEMLCLFEKSMFCISLMTTY